MFIYSGIWISIYDNCLLIFYFLAFIDPQLYIGVRIAEEDKQNLRPLRSFILITWRDEWSLWTTLSMTPALRLAWHSVNILSTSIFQAFRPGARLWIYGWVSKNRHDPAFMKLI